MKPFLLFLIIGSLLLSCNKDPNLEPPKHDDYEVIDFDDYAFQLYCIENFDLNKDGQIQYFEVKNVEGIDVTKKQIKSLYLQLIKNHQTKGDRVFYKFRGIIL